MKSAEEDSTTTSSIREQAKPSVTVRNTRLDPLQKAFGMATILVPTLGTVLAIVLAVVYGVDATALWLCGIMFVLTNLALEFGFHRNLAHKAVTTYPVIKYFFAVAGSMAGTGRILFWIANHRRHHIHSDEADDPHSPHVKRNAAGDVEEMNLAQGLWHAHYGHVLTGNQVNCTLFASDINRDQGLKWINDNYIPIVFTGLLIPAVIGGVIEGSWMGALTGFLWGGLVRMFLVHQSTWGLASYSHRFGPSPFYTGEHDQSSNNVWVAIASFGSGWQNNHHAFPTSAFLGLKWYQIDMTAWFIVLLEKLGLAWNVKRPSKAQIKEKLKDSVMV